jgi:hypothetical protein
MSAIALSRERCFTTVFEESDGGLGVVAASPIIAEEIEGICSAMEPIVQAAVDRGDIVIDFDELDRCAERWRKACKVQFWELVTIVSLANWCPGAVAGQIPLGHNCPWGQAYCEGGTACGYATNCTGTCVEFPTNLPEGSPCQGFPVGLPVCDGSLGLVCDSKSECRPGVPRGGACVATADCASGLVCTSDHLCRAGIPSPDDPPTCGPVEGNLIAWCPYPLRCEPVAGAEAGACVRGAPAGEPCEGSLDCAPGLACFDRSGRALECTAPLDVGQVCQTYGIPCGPWAGCIDGTCRRVLGAEQGEPCATGYECASAICVKGRCATAQELGAGAECAASILGPGFEPP